MWLEQYTKLPLVNTNHLFLQFFLLPNFIRYPLRMTLFGSVEMI